MYIIVGGGGMIGGTLARRLLENKHDVVLIDQSKEVCDKAYADSGVVAVNGSVAHIEVLEKAGIEKADVLVAATGSDANNLACAVLGKSARVPHIIARMRHPAYENAYKLAGVNTIVRVTDLMVNQMVMDIENPKLHRITSIGGGRANIFTVTIPKDAKVAGKRIEEIVKSRKFPSQCTFIAVFNQQKKDFSIPRGKQVINEGDEIFLISKAENIKQAVEFLTAVN